MPKPSTSNKISKGGSQNTLDARLPSGVKSARRYDLDWVRILAFGLLILYHVGMYYVAGWGWHIKSDHTSVLLQKVMYLTNPWRMSMLFFVSGMAVRFAARSINTSQLLSIRTRRLLLPLIFGMAVIVPPQLYAELVTKEGMEPGYFGFLMIYWNAGTDAYPDYHHGPLGLWTWNHLWFLAYLYVYTLAFVGIKPVLDRLTPWFDAARLGWFSVLVVPIALLTVYRWWLSDDYPPTNAIVDDWYNHARYLSFMLGGYLIAGAAAFWNFVDRYRWRLLAGAGGGYVGLLLLSYQAMPGLAWVGPEVGNLTIKIMLSFDQWLWIAALLGLAKRYLNHPSPLLDYMNVATLPWYMLHQTLIILLAFGLMSLELYKPIEALMLIVGTVAGCALGYEVIRRFSLGRVLFGLKGAPGQ